MFLTEQLPVMYLHGIGGDFPSVFVCFNLLLLEEDSEIKTQKGELV